MTTQIDFQTQVKNTGQRIAALRQIASRSNVSNINGTTGSFVQLMTRTFHYARDNIAALKIVLSNWYVDSTGEHAALGTATFTASIEYPIGTLTQITFGNATSSPVSAGSNLISDLIALANAIPTGALFCIRVWQSNPSFVTYLKPANSNGLFPFGGLDASVFSATTTPDQTMNAAWAPASAASNIFFPTAILGYTSKAAIAIIGDSQAQGFNDGYDVSGDRGPYARSVGKTNPYSNFSAAGMAATQFISTHTRVNALINSYFTHVVCQQGRNDLTAGQTAAQIVTSLSTIVGYYPGLPVYLGTQFPRTTGSWTTISGQTVTAQEAARLTLNSLLRSGSITSATGIFEVGRACESPIDGTGAAQIDSGFWSFLAAGTPIGIVDDGAHPNMAGSMRVANSAVINPALFI